MHQNNIGCTPLKADKRGSSRTLILAARWAVTSSSRRPAGAAGDRAALIGGLRRSCTHAHTLPGCRGQWAERDTHCGFKGVLVRREVADRFDFIAGKTSRNPPTPSARLLASGRLCVLRSWRGKKKTTRGKTRCIPAPERWEVLLLLSH